MNTRTVPAVHTAGTETVLQTPTIGFGLLCHSVHFQIESTILPSVEMVTTCQGIHFPLFLSACTSHDTRKGVWKCALKTVRHIGI